MLRPRHCAVHTSGMVSKVSAVNCTKPSQIRGTVVTYELKRAKVAKETMAERFFLAVRGSRDSSQLVLVGSIWLWFVWVICFHFSCYDKTSGGLLVYKIEWIFDGYWWPIVSWIGKYKIRLHRMKLKHVLLSGVELLLGGVRSLVWFKKGRSKAWRRNVQSR